MENKIYNGNCLEILPSIEDKIDLTFLDPPFNQNKDYRFHNDNLSDLEYWSMMKEVCSKIFNITSSGGAIYFMQRDKNTENVLNCLRTTGWSLQNLIIWKKKTSAVPNSNKFGKHYQIIAFACKGEKARIFNKLRISPPLPPNYKNAYENGVFVTDVWDDIRELTSGYYAGDEAIRTENGDRFHKQQSPISLLLRVILSSSNPYETILDPFAGTGTTLVVAKQLQRNYIGIEIDPENVMTIHDRLNTIRKSDIIEKYYNDYIHTDNLKRIWDIDNQAIIKSYKKEQEVSLFEV
ncbi:MAG: modification methylase [Ignavibacteria bacterium]|nr:modification methylase [Ignavibacteria bacterium]